MKHHTRDDLWRDFPKTATEFEARFATEEDLWRVNLGETAALSKWDAAAD